MKRRGECRTAHMLFITVVGTVHDLMCNIQYRPARRACTRYTIVVLVLVHVQEC